MGRLTDDMARLRNELNATRNARRDFRISLGQSVAEMRAGFRENRKASCRKAKAERIQFLRNLAAYVSGLKLSVLGMRQKFAEDIAGARQVWQGRGNSPERGRKREAPGQFALHAESGLKVMEAAKAVSEAAPDDFTVIPGIGSARMERLNRAGIHSFAQLSRYSPEELLAVLGKTVKSAEAQRWVARAGELAGHH